MRSTYPFVPHLLCLLPTAIVLFLLQWTIGSEEAVFAFFSQIRETYPTWTRPVALYSNAIPMLFYPLYLFFLVYGWRKSDPRALFFAIAYLVAQVLISALLCRIAKIAVGRPRPMTGGPFSPFSFGWGYQSFPSGHSAEMVGAVVPFLWRFGRFLPFVLPAAGGILVASVCFSRIYLGMHHPTDIWGGLVFGSISGYVSWKLYTVYFPRWLSLLPLCVQQRFKAGKTV